MVIGTNITGWIQNYASSAQVQSTSTSVDNLKNLLSQGCVFAVHSSSYSAAGHYFAIIDINEDRTQVYVSNPWAGGTLEGWCDINEVSGYLDAAFAISNDGDVPSNSPVGGTVASTTTTNVVNHIVENDRDGYKIDVDLDEKADELIEKLEESGNSRLLQYFSDRNRKKCLKSFLKSSIVTQYPDLRKKSEIGTDVPEEELQGVVKVRRRTESTEEDDKGEFLQYIPLDEFNSLKISGDNRIFNYFTLDSNSNIVVAGYEKRTVEPQQVNYGGDTRRDTIEDQSLEPMYNITLSKIDYLNQIEKYCMPFDLLWTLLVYSQDEDFVYNLSELAVNSNIEITVHDNITYIDTTDVYNYTKNVKIHEQATFHDTTTTPPRVESRTYEDDRPDEHYNYTITNKDHYESNNPSIALTYVDCWLLKYEAQYRKSHQGPYDTTNTMQEDDDADYVDDGEENIGQSSGDYLLNTWIADYESRLNAAYPEPDDDEDEEYNISYSISNIKLKYKRKVTGRERTITTVNESNTYQSQPGVITEKIDPNAEEDNFVKLLKHSGRPDNLKSVADWFFESLEAQESICDLVDLMKFLLYKTYNINYGVTDFNFSTFNPENFVSANSGVQGGLLEMLKSFENDALRIYMNGGDIDYSYVSRYVTQDRNKYKMYYTSFDGCLNFSYGVMVRDANGNLNNEGYFAEEGINLSQLMSQYNSGQTVLVDSAIVDRIKEKIVMNAKENIREKVESHGVHMEEHQLEALTMVSYQYGNCGQYISGSQNIAEIYKRYGNTEEFKANAICQNGGGGYTHFLSAGLYPNRERYTWKLFHEGIYTLADGTVITGNSIGTGGTIVQKAIECHRYLRENNYTYGGGYTIPDGIYNSSKIVDCSAYVSWVLYCAGYDSFEGHQETSFGRNHHELIEVSSNDIKPGDILVYPHHVEIAAKVENGRVTRVYNCGSTSAIRSAGTADCPESSQAWQYDYVVILRAPN